MKKLSIFTSWDIFLTNFFFHWWLRRFGLNVSIIQVIYKWISFVLYLLSMLSVYWKWPGSLLNNVCLPFILYVQETLMCVTTITDVEHETCFVYATNKLWWWCVCTRWQQVCVSLNQCVSLIFDWPDSSFIQCFVVGYCGCQVGL